MMRITLAALFGALAIAPVATQQPAPPAQGADQPPPVTFKVEVNYVELDAVVTDAQGKFVAGLTRDDFEVVEASKPQTISVFSHVNLPVERHDAPLFAEGPVEPDVRSNRREFDGRVFVLVLDDLHTGSTRSQRLRLAAREFVTRFLGANDLAAVVSTGGSTGVAQNFTTSRRLLLRAIDSFLGQKLRSETLEKLAQLSRPAPGGRAPGDPLTFERAYKARAALDTLKGVAEYLEGIRGRRKGVVFFSEGIDYDYTNPFQNQFASDVLGDMKTAIAQATRANVSFYAIDPRGLAGFEDAIDIQALPEDNSLGMHTLHNEMRLAQDSLRTLAEETGGFAAVNRNDYRDTFARIITDNSSYYVLGYYSSDDRRDGRFRPVEVRVKRPGLQVRTRKGYTMPRRRATPAPAATSAGTSPQLREALESPLPVSALGMAATAAAFRGPANKASVVVAVEIDGSTFRFQEKGDRVFDEVELSMIAFDSAGKGRDGGRDMAGLTLRPQTRDAVVARGVRIMRRLELGPGIYHLRIGAREAGSESIGTLMLDLDVPDFSKAPLVMSNVVLTSSSAAAVPTARADEHLKGVLPAPPTAIREFSRGDELTSFVEVYDNRPRTPHRVEIKTTLLADDGAVAFSRAEERRSEELGPAGGGYGHTAKIPLADVAPGRYVLRVEARSLVSDGGSAMRDLEVRVR